MPTPWTGTFGMSKMRPTIRVVPFGVPWINLAEFLTGSPTPLYKSGLVFATVSNITWTGSPATGETLNISIQPARYNTQCNSQALYTPLVSAGAWGGSTYKNVTAINYGLPGPSAILEPDGTITYLTIDLSLASNAFTDIASSISVTVTGDLDFTPVPTTSPVGGTTYTPQIGIGPEAALAGGLPSWGMATQDLISGYLGVAVQLQSLLTRMDAGGLPRLQPTVFQLSNPKSEMGQTIANVRFPIGQGAARQIDFMNTAGPPITGGYTYLFAINDGMVDANATPIQAPAGQQYNLCNFGLTQGPNSQDTVSADLTYELLTITL